MPGYETIRGTAGDDLLVATDERQKLLGLAGADTLQSAFNLTRLYGGDDNDALQTRISGDYAVPVKIFQRGDNDDDTLEAGFTGAAPSVLVTQKGGHGSDDIVATVAAKAPDAATEALTTQILIDAGKGENTVTATNVGTLAAYWTGVDVMATNVLTGLGGDDNFDAAAKAVASEGDSTARNALTGGGGDNRLVAEARAESYGDVLASNRLTASSGDDYLEASAFASNIGFMSNFDSSAMNELRGGAGNDTLISNVVAWSEANDSSVSQILDGGSGNDTLTAKFQLFAEYTGESFAILRGGYGHDTLTLEGNAIALSGHSLTAELSGGGGNDSITAFQSNDSISANGISIITDVSGGGGRDSIMVTSRASGDTLYGNTGSNSVLNTVAGGDGNDAIKAEATVSSYTHNGGWSAVNTVAGGAGNDIIAVTATASGYDDGTPEVVSVTNTVDGGSGHDVITATTEVSIFADGIGGYVEDTGQSHLSGASGNDTLTVFGCSGNTLDGGYGHDRLTGSLCADFLTGGGGRDIFVFDVTVDHGADTITDLDAKRDSLEFAGLTDEGIAGLCDDLDLITTVTDEGDGDDVVALFDSGSEITFAGCGTGDITSICDLFANPADQILA